MNALIGQMGDIWFFTTVEGGLTFSIILIASIIIIILVLRKMRKKRKAQQSPVSSKKKVLTHEDEKELLRKFQKLIDISNRIRKAEVAQFLDIPESQLLDLLVVWGKSLPFKVDGDHLVVEDVSAFTKALDKQFEEWSVKEQSKVDKN